MLIGSTAKYGFAQTHTCNNIHKQKQTHELQKTTLTQEVDLNTDWSINSDTPE
jgi:hypothetical protein